MRDEPGQVDPPNAEPVLAAAARIASIPGLGLEQRRRRLLRYLGPTLGAAQLEHIVVHCEHVGRTAARLAHLMRLPPLQVERTRLAGLLHDLGKIRVPEAVLGKPGPLSTQERAGLDRHAADGAQLCRVLGAPSEISDAVLQHHRDADGSDNPSLPPPPLGARILRVADALAVMTTGRAYSSARTFTQALSELRSGKGRAFDEGAVVAAHILGASIMSLAA
jgi:putative nucleotidyltransferase with HDIG domain